LLEFALSVVGEPQGDGSSDDLLRSIRQKLASGDELSEYEYHVFVEIVPSSQRRVRQPTHCRAPAAAIGKLAA